MKYKELLILLDPHRTSKTLLHELAVVGSTIFELKVIVSDASYKIGWNPITRQLLNLYLQSTGESFEELLLYLREFKNMIHKPSMAYYAHHFTETQSAPGYILDEDSELAIEGRKEDLLDAVLSETLTLDEGIVKSQVTADVDYVEAVVKIAHRLLPVIKKNNDLINEFLENVYTDHFKALMDYLALYTFENRMGIPRPTLVLVGARGTGKSMIVERFMCHIYPGSMTPLPSDAEKYGSWKFFKLVLLDEGETSNLTYTSLYSSLKMWSSETYSSIREMNKEAYNVKTGFYNVIIANRHPFNIKDLTTDVKNNQFLVLNIDNVEIQGIPRQEWIMKFKNRFDEGDYDAFFHDHLGYWLRTTLLDHYKKMKEELVNSPSRYGMDVPITDAYTAMGKLSESSTTTATEQFVTAITGGYLDRKLSEYETVLKDFKTAYDNGEDAFLPNSFFADFCKVFGIKNANALHHTLAEMRISFDSISNKRYRIGNTNSSQRGKKLTKGSILA